LALRLFADAMAPAQEEKKKTTVGRWGKNSEGPSKGKAQTRLGRSRMKAQTNTKRGKVNYSPLAGGRDREKYDCVIARGESSI